MNIVIDNSIDDSAIGGNASAEDASEGGADDTKETAINLVYAFKLKKYELDKKAYTKYIKDYDVYINEDYNEDGMLPLLNYREDGTTPYFTYFAAGVKGVKCLLCRWTLHFFFWGVFPGISSRVVFSIC